MSSSAAFLSPCRFRKLDSCAPVMEPAKDRMCNNVSGGIDVAQSTVSIYMVPRQDRPLQTLKTFLRNHMEGIASIDLFVFLTIAFQQLFAFVVLSDEGRVLVC